MPGMTATCITCHRELAPDETVSGFCPTCLYTAGLTPAMATDERRSSENMLTSWTKAFPQFDPATTLRELPGFVAMAGALVSDDYPEGAIRAALMVWSGQALAAEGGSSALLVRLEALRLAKPSGIAEVVDAGDLPDATYLLARIPDGFVPLQDLAGEGADDLSLDLLLPALGKLTGSVRAACGVALGLDPALIFRDSDGALCLLPKPTVEGAAVTTDSRQNTSLQPGQQIESYALVKRIGEGGFGEVWQAQQDRPAKRTVAVKVLKQGLISPRMLIRFEVEQQALARLDHPHIARFFDGGTTPDGRPFFAMEWIEGRSITDFCTKSKATIGERLHLFGQVCGAVQHAHRKGLIHRDLKASNVMVANDGEEASVKLIDFGIARALEEPLTDRTLLTRAEEIVGTPVAMSPEQAAGIAGAELDARTDVYGLGVLLYELLSGVLPFDENLPADELRRHIREVDPPKPSTRTDKLEQGKALRGDLDWIVMRCLEKEPERRYESVTALADDLERYANDEPVAAGPPDLAYRTRKFVRRHRLGLAVTGVVAVALVAGITAALFGLISAQKERANAVSALKTARSEAAVSEAVNRFLTEELLTLSESDGLVSSDPRNHDIPLRAVLERAAARIDGRFDEMPEVEAALRRALAASFFAVGEFEKGGIHATRAVTLYESTLGEDDPRCLETLRLLASVRTAQGKTDDARRILHRIVMITGERPGEIPETLSKAEFDILHADLIFEEGAPYAAAGGYLSAVRSGKLPPRLQARALSGFARGLEFIEPRPAVLAEHQRAVVFAEKSFGKDDALTLEIVRRYAKFLGDLDFGTYDEIARFSTLMQEVIARQTELHGRDHPDTVRSRFDYSFANGIVEALGPGALARLNELFSAAKAHYPDDHPELLRYQLGLAIQHGRGGDHQSAIELLESVVEGGLRWGASARQVVVEATHQLALSHEALGRNEEAFTHLRRAASRARNTLPPTNPARQRAINDLGQRLLQTDQAPESIEVFHEEYQACCKLLDSAHRHPARYLDASLAGVEHDRTGGLARAAAERALTVGGTPAPTIRSLLQLSLASQLCLRPSIFSQPTPPLPDAYFRLLEVESNPDTGASKREIPPRVLASEAEWRFVVLGEGESPPQNWHDASFDDTAWRRGPAPIGFGEVEVVTDLRAGRGAGSRVAGACFRTRFNAADGSETKPSVLRLRCDDGAIVFLNGNEVIRFNVALGRTPNQDLRADGPVEPRTHDFLIPAGHLVDGENVLAAYVVQHSLTSSDLVFSALVHANVSLPMERLNQFDPVPAMTHLESWAPGLAPPLEANWRELASGMELALLGKWEEALDHCRNFIPASEETATHLRWFRQAALRQLDRADEAAPLFRKAIPPRDPSTPAEALDLTNYYNALFTEPWHLVDGGLGYEPTLKEFPVGTGAFDGLTFDARGIVQLSSPGIETRNLIRRYPRSIDDIAIGRKVSKLHLLSATLLPDDKDTVIAAVVIHYADGSEETFPLRYWHETLAYMVGTDAAPPEVRSGWRASDPYRPGMFKELFIATWENPRPETEVTSIDVRAAASEAALLIAGISVEPMVP